jgi:hypothetical protein
MYDLIKDHVDMDPDSGTHGMILNRKAFVPPACWKAHDGRDDYNSNKLNHHFDSDTSPNWKDVGWS